MIEYKFILFLNFIFATNSLCENQTKILLNVTLKPPKTKKKIKNKKNKKNKNKGENDAKTRSYVPNETKQYINVIDCMIEH